MNHATEYLRSSISFFIPVALAAIIIASIAPTLGWLEFSSSMENLNVTTALEIRRTGNWLVPTLQGKPRLEKPPLAAWITATLIPQNTMESLASPDHARRNAAYQSLAWMIRLTPLLAMGALLVLTFYIARIITDDDDIALCSLFITGTSLLFMRFSRYSTTDVYLAFFVAITNLFFLTAILKQRFWIGCIGGGVAMGLAFMSKGPPAILQTLVPLALTILLIKPRPKLPLAPLVTGLLSFIFIGGGWYLLVLIFRPEAVEVWRSEIAGPDTDGSKSYLLLIPYTAPWIAFFIVGVIFAAARRTRTDVVLLMLLIVPLLVMSFFRDSQERYMLPMLPAAAILTADAVVHHLRAAKWNKNDFLVNASHWIVVAGIGIAFPVAAAGMVKEIQTIDGRPWLSMPVGISAAALSTLLIFAAIVLQRRQRWLIVLVPVTIMLGMQALFMAGYSESSQGLAEYRPIVEAIWQAAPNAEVYNAHPRGKRPPPEIGVYLNRVIPLIADPLKIEQGNVPKVVLLHPNKNDPEPTMPPLWQLLDKRGEPSDRWWAYILPASKP